MIRVKERKKKSIKLPTTFRPLFWDNADGRCSAVKAIKRRYRKLLEDSGADSFQKDLLCQRASFLATQLETAEMQAIEGGTLDISVHTQMLNAFIGLLKAIGLQKKAGAQLTLKKYIKDRA